MKNWVKLLFIVLVLVVGISIGTYSNRSVQPHEEAPQKQVEQKTIDFFRSSMAYTVFYVRLGNNSANDSIKVNIEYDEPYYGLGHRKLQLNNEVIMNVGDILAFTDIDLEDPADQRFIISYLGFYPKGDAIVREYGTVDEAKNYINSTLGIDRALINVIKRKTGD